MKKIIKNILLAAAFAGGIIYGGSHAQAYEISGFYQYEVGNDDTVTITKYTGGEETVDIPSEINGKKVTTLGDDAFKEGLMKYVNIPDTVTYIGQGTFYNCDSLVSVVIPDSVAEINSDYEKMNSSVYNSKCTFGDCDNLANVTIGKNVSRIGRGCFRNCQSLRTVTIKEGADFYIGYAMFLNCESLEEITIPSTVPVIGDDAFSNCISLTNLVLKEGLQSIGQGAFYNCDSLVNVVIPDSVAEINSDYEKMNSSVYNSKCTFGDCDNLTNVTIGKNVSRIGRGCFRNCPKLQKIIIPKSVSDIGTDILKDSPEAQICGIRGSAAESYAIEHDIPFAALEEVPMTSLSFSTAQYDLPIGAEQRLTVQMLPENTTDGISWMSSDESIAVVDPFRTICQGHNAKYLKMPKNSAFSSTPTIHIFSYFSYPAYRFQSDG